MIRSNHSETIIAPSILAADFGRIGEECRAVAAAGADWLHLDVMDGHFVDNISFGPAICTTARRTVSIPTDVHLMIERPDHYLERFLPSANNVTVHVEAKHDVRETLARIREAGVSAGLSLKPGTPFEAVEPYLDQIDLLLVMTVEPGFGGQPFIPEMLTKTATAAAAREARGLAFHIEVDGGIQPEQARLCRAAGANAFVAGTSIFGQHDYAEAIRNLRG